MIRTVRPFISLNINALRVMTFSAFMELVLQISRLSEGSTGQIFATSSVIYHMKMLGL